MKKYQTLRQKYPFFIYRNYQIQKIKKGVVLKYQFELPPDFYFCSTVQINATPKTPFLQKLDNLAFHLGLVEMLNYWKLCASPVIQIEAGNLSREGKSFLRKIILKGMGEYFYKNQINFVQKKFIQIKVNSKKPLMPALQIKSGTNKFLIPIGGGKDSAVIIEILKRKGNYLGAFVLNPTPIQLKMAQKGKIQEIIKVRRKLDPLLFELNKKGFLNGHVPFSAFLAFLSLIVAYLFNYQKIAFGWEKSANEPNLKYKGRWINHQWSKTSEFEKLFQNYANKYLLKNVTIFSPIRGFNELEIAQVFAKLKQYHRIFVSCNNAFKLKQKKYSWCGRCPKCLFVFASLYPFLSEKELVRIFKKNLFQDKSLIPLMNQLIAPKYTKPFECVGTKKEAYQAFALSLQKALQSSKKLPPLLEYFQKHYFG